MIRIHNTLTKQLETIEVTDKKLQMFVCGPTVYDYIHIGNARTFVFFDVVAKYLKYSGYKLEYIQNITDIDDKIINRAKEENRTWKEVADLYFEEFKKDAAGLGIDSPKYIRATDHIEEVKKQVKVLIKKGFAYLVEGDGWYFDLSKYPNYGKLSGRTAQMADDAVSRIDESVKKKNSGDFALWKLAHSATASSRDSAPRGSGPSAIEPSWPDDELGAGRPGWHIEDTAITEHFFGPQYELHGGGQDLMFPHHEAEIAQQESVSGKAPFVKYWMHVAFLVNKDEKMSKSLGNFTTANELLKKYSKETLRFYLLSGHYRKPLEFSEKGILQAEAGIRRIQEFIQKLKTLKGHDRNLPEGSLSAIISQFDSSLKDDFNTPKAFASVFLMIREVYPKLDAGTLSSRDAQKILDHMNEVDSILGIIPEKYEELPPDIKELINEREKLRSDKNFSEADKIRDKIQEKGWQIEDTIYGPLPLKRR